MAVSKSAGVAQLQLGLRVQMSVAQAARFLEITPQSVRALVRAGKLIGSREAGPLVVDQESVIRYKGERGTWNRFGVTGGNAALERMGMRFPKGAK